MPQAVKSNLFLYADDSCPIFQGKDVRLNGDFTNICEWFVDNMGQNALSFIGPSIWNKTPEVLKKTNNINTFKHKKILPNTA